jgi:hypothetical protein
MTRRQFALLFVTALVLLLAARARYIYYGWSFHTATDLESIERMVDTRDPKTVSGSFWKQKLDCTFKNPPPELSLKTLNGCESESHNAAVMRSARTHYFVPYDQMKDAPPYCLVTYSTNRIAAVDAARKRQRLYCGQQWSLGDNLLFEAGEL